MKFKFPPVKEQIDLIKRGTEEIIPIDELEQKLERSLASGNPLNIKLGCDPSRPDLHLGHTVVLRKLRQFQDLGHYAILIVGDFTGMIGDPSGKSKTRPSLTLEETRDFGRSYFEQASKVIDGNKAKIVYNSEWLSKMYFEDVIKLASKYTIARMLERDDFEKRYKGGEPISIHEILYPLAQAMDSVAIKSDVELGGTDQKFNLLVGRDIQREFDQAPQVILTLPILPGTDGIEKMSKSLDNFIGISESPGEIYGKTLSIPDSLIYKYFELVTDISQTELDEIRQQLENQAINPRNLKRKLARILVAMYYSEQASIEAEQNFDKIFIKKEVPEDVLEVEIKNYNQITIIDLLRQVGVSTTNSDARRLVQQGGVKIGGEKLADPNEKLLLKDGDILKVGKRKFYKLIIK
ncbi:MAG: tyrosine--tRNA ligase [Bacteroidetes bacterium]|nr:tyrosine--tRNA ligase [Bacteroidota bacterium]MBU2585647.1 tyrosine--tRNA ligase [Bacteroidota bacterium]